MTKQNKFCKTLSNALSFRIPDNSNAITFNPCCLYDEYLPFHPTVFKKQREHFINATDGFLPGCSKCELKEKTHGSSHRTGNNRRIPDGIGDDIWKLEIALDTTCNAACIQCGPLQSSLWRKLESDITRDKKVFHIQPENQIEDGIRRITDVVDLSKVRQIHFWGGEPLITKTHLWVLNLIPDLSDVELIYTSNLSVFPDDDVLNLWSKCKTVFLGLSVDGIGDQFEFIRWPLGWNKVTGNMKLYQTSTPLNVQIGINTCILPLNVLHCKTLEDWLRENFSSTSDRRLIEHRYIRGEGMLDVANTPLALREEAFKLYAPSHPICRVLEEVVVEDSTPMIRYLDRMDPIRGTNWRSTFSDISKYFETTND